MAACSSFFTAPTFKSSALPLSSRPMASSSISPATTSPVSVGSITATSTIVSTKTSRRELAMSGILSASAALFLAPEALAVSSEEYAKDTAEMIGRLRTTINLDKKDPNVATAVSELRDASNSWVSKYRREKELLGRPSFRDMYSALNAVSGHYISFGPTAPIPAKRKTRILEEVDTAEKALLRGR